MGVIRLRRSGQTYKGVHEPLVPPSVFQRVQDVAAGKAVRGPNLYEFRFSRLIQCASCGRSLIAERHRKSIIYYRCHKRRCVGSNIREEVVEAAIWDKIKDLHLMPEEIVCIDDILAEKRKQESSLAAAEVESSKVQLNLLAERQKRTTDAYVDGALDRKDFEQRKAALLMERCELENKLARAEAGKSECLLGIEQKVALVKHASLLYENGLSTETRDLLTEVVSHISSDRKNLMVAVKKPLSAVALRPKNLTGGSVRGRGRTFWLTFLLKTTEINKFQHRTT